MPTDQLGRTINLKDTPRRIVSLVPSITELLVDLGLRDSLVGVTKFCIHPENLIKEIGHVGGTKNPNIKGILKLAPDLVIANKEENRAEDIEALSDSCAVYVSDINTIADSLALVSHLGLICDRTDEAAHIRSQLSLRIDEISRIANKMPQRKVLYFIWQKPYMMAGTRTYIAQMMALFNLKNALPESTANERYPDLQEEEILALKPELLLLSTEPYPFKQSHAEALNERLMIPAKIVDGELFSWYGTRLLHLFPSIPEMETAIPAIFR